MNVGRLYQSHLSNRTWIIWGLVLFFLVKMLPEVSIDSHENCQWDTSALVLSVLCVDHSCFFHVGFVNRFCIEVFCHCYHNLKKSR